MKLKTKTDYCLRVLIYVQQHIGKVKIQDIADAHGISKNHLSIAVNKLSELGYIISTQGPKGGIEFNPLVADKTVGELLSKIEDFEIVECFDASTGKCRLSSSCKLKMMLHRANNAFLDELHRYKIKELV